MKVTRVEFSAPKPVYLKEESDFKTFEETLKPLAEKCLSTDWEWTFKVGGKVQREIEKYEPGSEILVRIKEKKEDGEGGTLVPLWISIIHIIIFILIIIILIIIIIERRTNDTQDTTQD